ncbi:helix-turn-helix transcriptional regulator, partial [Actinomadura kijaniata]|uniref:helix-turn-helix transcriptional regulator n=1 Tax=Actinomadura kijaniata TaxID=46161 RepID=UPI001C3F4306
APALRRALAAARAGDALAAGRESWYVLVFVAAMELWDDDAFDDLTGRGVAIARELGAFATLQTAVHSAGMIEMWRGDFTRARAYFAEFVEVLNMVSGSPGFAEPSDVTLKAWRGERDRVAASLDYLEDNQHAPIFGGNILVLYLARCARVVLATGGSRYAEVIAEARRAYAENLPYGEHFTLPDFVEAGVRGGDREVAREGMRRLTERALAAGTPWALGLLARSRALLAPDDGAEPHYQEAIDLLGGTRVRTDLARAHLLYGEWLRRRRRRGDARARLRTAHEMFTGMGAAAFAERARLELRAIGDRVAGRAASGGGRELTAQERRVAELAAAGATNAEIATQLFVSASTVEYHLRKVFRKLGITSRRQLARDQLL